MIRSTSQNHFLSSKHQMSVCFTDVIAAAFTGLALCWLDLANHLSFLSPLTFGDVLQSASIKVSAFVLVALVITLLRRKLRLKLRLAWLLIAVAGLTLVTCVDEIIVRSNNPEPEFFAAFSPLPMEIILYIVPTVLIMGAGHFVGLLVASSRRRRFV